MKLDEHYVNPKLVDLYDLENPAGPDTDFYLQLAASLQAKRLVDFGCGTGLLTRALATAGRQVVGVDPAAAMLAYAQRQPAADRVTWVLGGAEALPPWEADLAVMTGNVAQVFLEDAAWAAALAGLRAALRPGGHLAFESRNPLFRAWEQWTPENSRQTMASPHGPVESWLEVVSVTSDKVSMRGYNRFLATGEEIVVDSTLCFRSEEVLTRTLEQAGFVVEQLYGGWQQQPFTAQSPFMVFVAQRLG